MELFEAIDRALSGRGGFQLRDGSGRASVPDLPSFSAYAGIGLLWPLSNRPDALWALFRALADRAVPILLPEGSPPGKLEELRNGHPHFGYFDGSRVLPPTVMRKLDPEIFLVVPTSGSTGEPKLVAAGTRELAAAVSAIAVSQDLGSLHHTGVILPLAHSYALVNQLFWALSVEGAVTLAADPGWADRFRVLRQAGVQMLCMVGTQARALVSLGFGAPESLESLRVCNFAGAPFPVEVFEELRQIFPRAALMNNYGCTEAMPRLTACEVAGADHDVRDVGSPVEGVGLRISGEEGCGSVEFSGPSISLGLLDTDGGLRRHGEWVASGDLGRLEGDRLFVFGRYDQVIKVAGERISLLEVERVLIEAGAEHAAVWADVCEAVEPVVVAAVTGIRGSAVSQMERSLRGRLPRTAWPERIFHVEDWPLLSGRKTDRVALQRTISSGRAPCLWKRP